MATALFVVFAASTFLVASNAISCSSGCDAIPSCPGGYVLDDCNCSHCAQQEGDECDHPHRRDGGDTTRRPLICDHGLKCAKRHGVRVCERLVRRAVAPPCAEPTPCTAERQVCVATRRRNIECKAANCSFPFPFYGCSIVSHAHRLRTCACWKEKACASPHEYSTNKECRTALRFAGERRRSILPRCVQTDLACPIDSKSASTSTSSSSSSCSTRPECECDQSKCPPIDCPSANYKAKVIVRKRNVPGTCCPMVACRQEGVTRKCWRCLWTDHWNDRVLKCPPDSKAKPGETTLGGCCKLPSTCECDPAKCSIRCSLSEYPVLLRRGLGYPGRCCDEYACKADNSSCMHKGQRYASGSRWKEGCRDCLCFSTIVQCFPPQCPSSEPCLRYGSERSSGCCPKCLELASAGAVSFDVPKESGDGDTDSAAYQVCRERGDVYHKGMWIEDGRMFHTSDKWTRRLRTSEPLTCEGCRCNSNASRRAGSQGDTLCVPCPCLPGCQSGNGVCDKPASRCNGLCLFTNDEKKTDFFFPGDQWTYKCREYRCMDDGQITWASVCVSQPPACVEGSLVDLRDECCEVCSRPCRENITCNHMPRCTGDLTYERNKFGCRKSCTCVKEEIAIQPSINADCSKEVKKCKPCPFPTIRTKTGKGCCNCVLPDPCKLATCPHSLLCVSVYETTCSDVALCEPRAACIYGFHIVPDVKPTPIAMTPTVNVRTTTTAFPPLIAYTAILINDSYKLYREDDFRNDYSHLWEGAVIDDVKTMAPYDEDKDCTLVEDLADVSQKNRRKRSTNHLIPVLITVRDSKGKLLEPEVVAEKIRSGQKTAKTSIFPFVYVNTYAHFCANYQSLLKPSLPPPVSTEISTDKVISTGPDDNPVKPKEESPPLSKILPIAVPTSVIGCVVLTIFLVVGFYYCKVSMQERRMIQQSKERKQRKVQLREPQIQDEFEVNLEEEEAEEQEERNIDIEERRRSNDDTLSISSSFGIEIDENAAEESYTNSVVRLDEEAEVVTSLRDDDDDDVHVPQLVGSTSI
ncbi:cysteine-rich motor neuron 1 protein-like isoform X2 [Oscarella lobularis]